MNKFLFAVIVVILFLSCRKGANNPCAVPTQDTTRDTIVTPVVDSTFQND